MAIDISRETVVSLTQGSKLLPRLRAGRPVHVATLYRWATRGVRGIRLEVANLGGSTITSTEALQRFVEQLTAARIGHLAPVESGPPPSRRDQHERAERVLDALGI